MNYEQGISLLKTLDNIDELKRKNKEKFDRNYHALSILQKQGQISRS